MNVIYKELKDGYILKKDDILVIHGIEYRVTDGGSDGNLCWLSASCPINSVIFDKLRIDDKYAFVNDICAVVSTGDFPEVGSYEDLTKVAIALYETPEFKVGDKVKVSHRVDDEDDYPYSFSDDMTKLEGKEFIVKSCRIGDYSFIGDFSFIGKAEKRLNEDPHIYGLKDEGDFIWHSSMLEKVFESDKKSEKSSKVGSFVKPLSISLYDLQLGYILKDGNIVCLCGEEYRVFSGDGYCFLINTSGGTNGNVFIKLGINDKMNFCSSYGSVSSGDFPEFNRLDALTACVKQLMLIEQDSFGKGDSGDASLPEAIKCERINFTMDISEPDEPSDTGIIRLPEIKDDFKIIL